MKKSIYILTLFFCHSSFSQLLPQISMPPGYTSLQVRYRNDVKIDNNYHVWIAFDSIGLGKYDGSAWTIYDVASGALTSDQVFCLAFDSAGNLLAGTANGISVFDGNSWMHYDTANSTLTGDSVVAIEVSGSNIYAGTNTGMHAYDGSTWSHFTTSNSSLGSDSITCFAKGNNNELYIGTKNGIYSYGSGIFTTVPATLPDSRISKLFMSPLNRLYITTPQNKTYIYDLLLSSTIDFFSLLPQPDYGCTYFGDTTAAMINYNSGIAIMARDPNNNQPFITWHDTTGQLYYTNFNFQHFGEVICSVKDSVMAIVSTLSFFNNQPRFYIVNLNNYRKKVLTPYFLEPSNLNVNHVNTRINNLGDHHWDRVSQTEAHQVPGCSGKHSTFTCGLWIGGYNSDDSLYISASTWNMPPDYYDYWPGPLDTVNVNSDSITTAQYDRVWKINKSTIDEFLFNFQQGNVANGTYLIPDAILDWPAHGTGNYSRSLAPFVDADGNGIYDPYQGDYPDMEGDQMIWFIFNDAFGTHGVSHTPSFGFEIHGKAYAYSCDSLSTATEALNYTTFYEYKIINRSSITYHDMRLGWWQPNAIGNPSDDYYICNVPLNTVTEYNSDIDDDGPGGFGLKPPSQNITLLKGPLADPNDGVDNNRNGTVDEPGETIALSSLISYINLGGVPNGRPNFADDYYQYLNAFWLDGLPLTYGSDGRNQANPPCKYSFPGTSDPAFSTPWTMATSGLSGGHYRKVLGFGNFTMAPGEERTIEIAYIYSRDTVGNWPSDAEIKNLHDVNSILYWYNNNLLGNCPLPVGIEEFEYNTASQLFLYPNPANQFVEIKNISSNKLQYEIADVNGRLAGKGILLNNKISTKDLTPGIYFISIQTTEGKVSGRVAVNR